MLCRVAVPDVSPAPEAATTDHRPVVLIADDEPLVVRALARQLNRVGLRFISDTSSEQVVGLAKAHQPKVIILDVNQHIDGRDLLAALKKDPATRDIKVIMLSAREDQFVRHVCLQLGAVDYDVKPFDLAFARKVARLAGVADPPPALH